MILRAALPVVAPEYQSPAAAWALACALERASAWVSQVAPVR